MKRRFRRRPSARSLFLAALLVVLVSRYAWNQVHNAPDPAEPLVEGPCNIVRVVDGDTLLVRQTANAGGPSVRLRLLGIDCPEVDRPGHSAESFGAEATQFTRAFVSSGTAQLRLDRRRLDRFKRHLAYLFVDDRMLNLELVRAGLARVTSYPGDSPSIARQLRRAESEARADARRLWSDLPSGNNSNPKNEKPNRPGTNE